MREMKTAPPKPLHGLMAEFTHPEKLLHAATCAHSAGYRRMDAYTPFPVEGLADALGHADRRIPLIMLIGGVCGGLGGYFLQWYSMAVDYPLNIGGRPFHTWPAFVPITFELTVLCAALAGMLGMLALNRLPEPYHPVFNVPEFERASSHRFFLCIEAADPAFDRAATRRFLDDLEPVSVHEVKR
jgi:hypothetical protein